MTAEQDAGEVRNHRVEIAELQKDVQYTAGAVTQLTAAVNALAEQERDGQEKQAGDLVALKEHFDARFEALRQDMNNQARGQAVFEACARQWQFDHEKKHDEHDELHKQEHSAQGRKNLIADVVSGLTAALLGIIIQPGRGP